MSGDAKFLGHFMDYYAHSMEGQPLEKWQPLEEHLNGVAEMAHNFAKPFGGENWAYLAGLWHDAGKGSKEFQAYIRKANNIIDEFAAYYIGSKIDHSTFGAKHLNALSDKAGKLLAYVIAGHHSGLMDWQRDANYGLKYRLEKNILPVDLVSPEPEFPEKVPFCIHQKSFGFQLQFFLRMIFSCLVDADYLDTEGFLSPEAAQERKSELNLKDLYQVFFKSFSQLRERSEKTDLNLIRERVLRDCLHTAEQKPGLFSLTVPTGGGKTLASMSFAFEHAIKYKKDRIIYVIPFTSIIEQNAKVFREMLGSEAVLEHHCNFIPDNADRITKLRTENWDAPIIVTTNVQFFDSLFSNKTSKCRKLHNIANSVIIFDEVQAVPVEKLQPCLEVIRELTQNYSSTAVLCTATQPAIHYSDEFKSGLQHVREIINDVDHLFGELKRTNVSFIGKQSNTSIANRMNELEQVLCVVNTRNEAKEIFNLLKEGESNFHLSALMYPEHRSRILVNIKKRLKEGKECRVVSTQLIEAGVDIDFPVVIRAISGMDSVAQAAGRCNREGKRDKGEVFIFEPEGGVPPGYFRQTAQCAKRLFDKFAHTLLEPACIREYFLNYYWLNQKRMDNDGVLSLCQTACRGNIQFDELSSFRIIKSATEPIIVSLGEDKADIEGLLEKLNYSKFPKGILRKLQRYAVQVYPYQMQEMEPYLETINDVKVLRAGSLYDLQTGLVKEVPTYLNAEDTVF